MCSVFKADVTFGVCGSPELLIMEYFYHDKIEINIAWVVLKNALIHE